MNLNRKQLFILMACLNSMSEVALRDLCNRFDFGDCDRAPIKKIKTQIKQRLSEHLIEPVVELPTDRLASKDIKVKHKRVFAIKVSRVFAVKSVKLDNKPKRKIRKIRFNG